MTHVIETARNGVDTEQMYGTLDAIKAQPELGIFQFRAHNHWIDGAHNRTTIQRFYGAGQEDDVARGAVRDRRRRARDPARHRHGGEPGRAPAPRARRCLTTSLVYVAAAARCG